MSFGASNWVGLVVLTALAFVETAVGIVLAARHSLTSQRTLEIIAIFLAALLLLGLKWLRAKRILGLCFLTVLCGFVTLGNLLTQRLAAAVGFGSIFLFGVFLMLRQLNRINN